MVRRGSTAQSHRHHRTPTEPRREKRWSEVGYVGAQLGQEPDLCTDCARDAAGQTETGETQKARHDFALQVFRDQHGGQRLPETAETHVVWLITQRLLSTRSSRMSYLTCRQSWHGSWHGVADSSSSASAISAIGRAIGAASAQNARGRTYGKERPGPRGGTAETGHNVYQGGAWRRRWPGVSAGLWPWEAPPGARRATPHGGQIKDGWLRA
jgi:hypothetical protein